jgi:hypothetical protein
MKRDEDFDYPIDPIVVDAHTLNEVMAQWPEGADLRDVVVPGKLLPGHGKRLRDCTDPELQAIAIWLRLRIEAFVAFVREQPRPELGGQG